MLTLGLPRMHKEAGERRDFLPSFVERMASLGVEVALESGIGSGMGLSEEDYARAGRVRFVDNATAYRQDLVLVLRSLEVEEFGLLRPGSTYISMLHFPTRPRRVKRLRELGVKAVSLDSLADDQGRRLVENMRSVAWNGLRAAYDVLAKNDPRLEDPSRPPVKVTVLGRGRVGKDAVEASGKYGSKERADRYYQLGLAGVEVASLGRAISKQEAYMRERLAVTDILVDACQRHEPHHPVIPNEWIACMPAHAVICDLAVDPYVPTGQPPTVRGIEGIPSGNLDQYVFAPDDPHWTRTIPEGVSSRHRRSVVSCYSWPGVQPRECMELYGDQLAPLLETLIRRGGLEAVRPDGGPEERALFRARLPG